MSIGFIYTKCNSILQNVYSHQVVNHSTVRKYVMYHTNNNSSRTLL